MSLHSSPSGSFAGGKSLQWIYIFLWIGHRWIYLHRFTVSHESHFTVSHESLLPSTATCNVGSDAQTHFLYFWVSLSVPYLISWIALPVLWSIFWATRITPLQQVETIKIKKHQVDQLSSNKEYCIWILSCYSKQVPANKQVWRRIFGGGFFIRHQSFASTNQHLYWRVHRRWHKCICAAGLS